VTAELAIGAIGLLAMIGVSWYGWVTLPSDARVPIHFGIQYNNFVPKRAGLIMHPAVGAVVLVILASVGHGSSGTSSHKPSSVILLATMGVLLIVQIGAIRVARRKAGADRSS
jgi:hypothetical protein